ncbi:APC family permease [Liquorilactobacillus nagelii]|uniref:APC family permease n=1 Tax=Liquorilactobacillus nagelii TaxID=82688 RepID=UPI0006F0EA84|nr:APC family permease [Liquorilactobacillus nagelii]KRL42293.1 amino acid permease [Liquorilactobacillus nagelii DSM 13675]QYH54997.1 APC family permease [Liquorilactobacillus nagelii DSM 13675]
MNSTSNKISLFNAVMLGLGTIIGSGWLFGSWEAARVAGPAAIISWVIGAVIIAIISYNYIELGTMLPENGGMSKYAQYTHGSLVGFIAAWANWIALITIIPIEAVAAVQYMSSWPWKWANFTNGLMQHNQITTSGLLVVFVFIIIFTLFNFWSVSLLTRFTSFISIFKIGIPLLTIIMLLFSSFHLENLGSNLHAFMPYGSAPIFKATTTAGIIFSFNAFQTIINIGSDLENPKVNIKRAINLSLLISGIIYILLQITFITAISPKLIARVGWSGINFNSPFADLAILLGIYWLSVLLYMDAFISPFGTGVSTVASTSRVLAAMVDNEHLPKFLGKINQRYQIPRNAMIANAVLSILMVTFFRSWDTLATVISTSMLIALLTGPVTLIAFRKMAPEFARPIKNSRVNLTTSLSFILASLAIYWAMWPTTLEVTLVILLGLPLYFYYEWKNDWKRTKRQFDGSWWMIFYLLALSGMSFIGSKEFNGINLIPYPFDLLAVIALALGFYYWGTNSNLFTKYFKYAKKLNYTKVMSPKRRKLLLRKANRRK